MTVQQFEGASAIVSGGAGGLGEATVRRLHADGLGVVIADLAADKGKALADELGSRAVFVSTDVTSEDSILGAVEQANQLGQLRYAVVAHGAAERPHHVVLASDLVESPRPEPAVEGDKGSVGHVGRAYPCVQTQPPGARCGGQVGYGTRPYPLRAAAFRP